MIMSWGAHNYVVGYMCVCRGVHTYVVGADYYVVGDSSPPG